MIKSLFLTVLLFTVSLTAIAQNDRTSRWNHSDGSTELSVTMRNDVRFNDDYTDVLSVGAASFLEVRERRGGFTRQLKIAAGANGQIIKTYTVNGEARAFDSEAKSWLAKMLDEAVSKGFDASARAAQIIRRSGASALLKEIPRLEGDYAKRVYFEEAVKSGNLDAGDLQAVLSQAASDISSDYEKATLLINIAIAALAKGDQREAYFAAADTIKSDYEHARVLKSVFKANPKNKEISMLTLASAAKITSDYEKANILIQIAEANIQDESIRAALLKAVKTVTSDHERGRVLNVVYLKEVK